MLTLELDPETVFKKHPDAKREFLAWAMSDGDFLSSFVELLATGCSPECSWPGSLDRIREEFHKAAGDEYLANALQRVQDADLAKSNAQAAERRMEYRLNEALKLWREVAPHIKHDQDLDEDWCPACRLGRALKGEE